MKAEPYVGQDFMNCPLCGYEMEKGGIVTDGIVSTWVPDNEFEKKGLKRIVYHNAKDIEESRVSLDRQNFPMLIQPDIAYQRSVQGNGKTGH